MPGAIFLAPAREKVVSKTLEAHLIGRIRSCLSDCCHACALAVAGAVEVGVVALAGVETLCGGGGVRVGPRSE